MNKITENLTACVKPELAVIVYRYKPIEDESSYYLERRDIDDSGKMGAGVPLTEDCISGIAKSFSSTDRLIVHGEIPANMLYADCRRKGLYFLPIALVSLLDRCLFPVWCIR